MPTTLEALSADLAAAAERAAGSVVAIHARRRIPASGVVWRPSLVVAADHTVHKAEDVRVSLADGTDVRARVVGRERNHQPDREIPAHVSLLARHRRLAASQSSVAPAALMIGAHFAISARR